MTYYVIFLHNITCYTCRHIALDTLKSCLPVAGGDTAPATDRWRPPARASGAALAVPAAAAATATSAEPEADRWGGRRSAADTGTALFGLSVSAACAYAAPAWIARHLGVFRSCTWVARHLGVFKSCKPHRKASGRAVFDSVDTNQCMWQKYFYPKSLSDCIHLRRAAAHGAAGAGHGALAPGRRAPRV